MVIEEGERCAEREAIQPDTDFGELNGGEPYNASEVFALADSRFLFCDNNVSDALFEFQLDPDGALTGPILRRQVEVLQPGAIDDI